MPWHVEFYQEKDDEDPIRQFLQLLPEAHRARMFQTIHLLETFGPLLNHPHSSQVSGKLRELRVQCGKAHYRLLYYGDVHRNFVLLHGFRKATSKLPKQEIETAVKRMERDIAEKEAEP